MDKEMQKKKPEQKEKDSSLNTILASSLAITILLLVELFLMIAMPQMLPAIAVVGVIIVGCAYMDLSTLIRRIRKKDQEQEEQYASILKSEKAAYLLIRKYFDEIEEQLTLLEDKFSEPFQEVVAAQKATAKVTINRNKENTDALMNSNDKMLELLFNLEGKIEETSQVLSAGFEERERDQNAALLQKQAEMSNQIRELELSLRNEILQAVNKLSSVSPQVVMAPPQMMPMQQPVSAPVNQEPEALGSLGDLENLGGLGDLPDFVPLDAVEEEVSEPESESVFGDMASEPELEPVAEPEPEPIAEPELEPIAEPAVEPEPIPEPTAEELPPMPDLSDPNKVMSPDEIAALLANMTEESSVVAEEVAEVEPEPVAEPEPEPIAEPVAEEKPPMPDLSDPNKVMSPDEIAALLANMTEESSVVAEEVAEVEPEPVAEPEPEPIAEPVAEEKPPMPDLSDPNRQMSPDEIAALFANLG